MLAGLSRVADHDAALEFIEINAQLDAMFAAGRQFDGRCTAKGGWVVVLRARGNVDDNSLRVPADVDPILFTLPCSRVAVQRGANGHSHGAGTADACAGWGFRVRHQ